MRPFVMSISAEQKRQDMLACAPWIRDALKSTNEKAKHFEALSKDLQEKFDQLAQATNLLKAKMTEMQQQHEKEMGDLKAKLER